MLPPVNASLVSLGLFEPAFQVQIVPRQVQVVTADEQSRLKAAHHLGHVLMQRIFAGLESISKFPKFSPTLLAVGKQRMISIKCCGDRPHILKLLTNLIQVPLYLLHASIDAVGQSFQLGLGAPPFLASRFRSMDWRISPNASAMRTPAGCRGPP